VRLVVFALVWLVLALPSITEAATIVVGNTNDGSNTLPCDPVAGCTLRQALLTASTNGQADDIVFAPELNGFIPLSVTFGPLALAQDGDLTITGPGAERLAIDGGGINDGGPGPDLDKRIFVHTSPHKLEIAGLTLANGFRRIAVSGANGGCIYKTGTGPLIIRRVKFDGCRVQGGADASATGGALAVNGAATEIYDSFFTSNLAAAGEPSVSPSDGFPSAGGAVALVSGGLIIKRSTFVNNAVTGSGNSGGGTTAGAGQGGAIHVSSSPSNTTIDIENVTVTANFTFPGGVGAVNSGGSLAFGSDATVRNSTIAGNLSNSLNTTGIAVYAGGDVTVTNTIIANNDVGNCTEFGVATLVGSNNLEFGDTTCAMAGVGVTSTADPQLAALADNGGYSHTMMPSTNSPARNAGTNTAAPNHDGRGRPRTLITGDRADIGAVEIGAPLPEVSKLADTADGVCLPSDCSLREAIAAAMSGETVRFRPTTTGTLTTNGGPVANAFGQLSINKSISVIGPTPPNPAALVISGAQHHRVFDVGRQTASLVVTLTALTVEQGLVEPKVAFDESGGGIRSNAKLSLVDSVVRNNVVRPLLADDGEALGGGIAAFNDLTLIRTVVSGNLAESTTSFARGGGVFLTSENALATMTIDQSTISGNEARGGVDGSNGRSARGGGIAAEGKVIITRSTIANNVTRGGSPNTATTGENGGDGEGAGIHIDDVQDGAADIINSTIANNQAIGGDSDIDGDGEGGGVFTDLPTNIVNSTIVGNTVTGIPIDTKGGGVVTNGVTLTIRNSIISGNLVNGASGNCATESPGGVIVGDHNLTQGDATCPGAAGFTTGDPLLGPLANNGGFTQTMLPGAGSPAIDEGTCFGAKVPKNDQRGSLRPSGPACDIGAVEVPSPDRKVTPASPATTPDAPRRGTGGSAPLDSTPNPRQ
jgi:CSLREA domain-containing protein